jgi:hypothetical protein
MVPLWLGTEPGGVCKNKVPLWLGTELGGSLEEYGTCVAGRSLHEYGTSVAGNRAIGGNIKM